MLDRNVVNRFQILGAARQVGEVLHIVVVDVHIGAFRRFFDNGRRDVLHVVEVLEFQFGVFSHVVLLSSCAGRRRPIRAD
jgi:hypothetical protein